MDDWNRVVAAVAKELRAGMTDDPTIINLSAKTTTSQEKFNRRIREERGDRCEVCGRTKEEGQIEAHHVLDRRAFPRHAKNPLNILVVCQSCHAPLTDCVGDPQTTVLMAYSSLPEGIRQRIAAFLEENTPRLATLIQALRRGMGYAKAVYWWRMEHKSLHPPEAYVRQFEADERRRNSPCWKTEVPPRGTGDPAFREGKPRRIRELWTPVAPLVSRRRS